ncbi:hypothetical protein [Methanobrevibacter sp.]|uniref:hypothetical protein n=1 Tax=Methanobrevibacter sp. TaxID=66852 RepID=UPI0038905971
MNHKDIKPKIRSQFNIPYNVDYSYDAAGYRITIPYKNLFDDELNGENRILMNYKQDGVEHNFFLGFKQIDPNNLKATHSKGKYFLITHDLNNDLVIDVSNKNFFNEKIAIEDDNLCIFSKEFKGNLFLDYGNPESQIPLAYNEDKHCYIVKINSFLDSKAKLTYENKELAVHKKSQVLFLNSKKGQIIVDTKNDFTFDISKYEVLSIISDIAQRNSKIDITIDYHCSDKYEGKLKSARLYFKNELDMMIYNLSEGKID